MLFQVACTRLGGTYIFGSHAIVQMACTLLKGGVLRPFLSLFVLSLLACHGGKGREKGTKRDKKGQKS